MRLRILFIVLLTCAVSWGALVSAEARTEPVKKIEAAIEAFEQAADPERKVIPRSLLKQAQAIAIIPGVLKFSFGLGGRHGKGVLLVRNRKGGWNDPFFVKLTGGSLGFQAGGQSTDVILLFKTKKSVTAIHKGKFTLGADAEFALGPAGRQVEAGTDIKFRAEIYSFSLSRGLFVGASLGGASLSVDDTATRALYGRSAAELGEQPTGKTPQAVGRLKALVRKHTQ